MLHRSLKSDLKIAHSFALTVSMDEERRLFLAGGIVSGSYQYEIFEYDAKGDKWVQTPYLLDRPVKAESGFVLM